MLRDLGLDPEGTPWGYDQAQELAGRVDAGEMTAAEAELRAGAYALAELEVQRLRQLPALDHTNADCAAGRSVARFIDGQLERRQLRAVDFGHALDRALRRWRDGARADFHVIDRWAVALGLLPQDFPNDCWRRGTVRGGAVAR